MLIRSISLFPLLRGLSVALLALTVAACASRPVPYAHLPGLGEDGECRVLLGEMEQRVTVGGVASAFGQPLPGYPYLRTSRFLSSFREQLHSPSQRLEWYQRLRALGTRARQSALDNLPVPYSPAERRRIESCIDRLAARDSGAEGFWERLPQQARAEDAYHGGMRALGLFPLTRLPVLRAISNEHGIWGPLFNDPALRRGESLLYRPPDSEMLSGVQVADWIGNARARSALGIPQPTPMQLQRLFASFAPAWRVWQHTDSRLRSADRIGRVQLRGGIPAIDSDDPVTYLLPSYTRYRGRVLLQLNYMIWFSERAPQRPGDIYAGPLDGLIWRVTLDSDGTVFSYDSIHPCGCYHKLFPLSKKDRIRPGVQRDALRTEPPLVLQRALPDPSSGRVVVHLYPSIHYVVGLTRLNPADSARRYRTDSYLQLLSLKSGQRRRSLFAADGLVPVSARTERYLLWPMGIRSAGAMRQWGHHAISFTGIRHFDDPWLMESFFQQK